MVLSPVSHSKEEFENMIEQDDVDSLYNILEYHNYEVDADEERYMGKLLEFSTQHNVDISCVLFGVAILPN